MKTQQRANKAGFTLVEIMIVVAIIGLLVAIAIPNFFKNRQIAQSNTCKSNLRVIDTAKQLWAIETGKAADQVPDFTDLVGSGLYLKREPTCPAGGKYDIWEVGVSPECSIAGHTLATN